MNKQLTFYVVAGLALLGMGGVVLVLIVKPESAEDVMKYVIQIIVIIGGFGGLAAIQNQQAKAIDKQSETLDTVKHNTNGTLTKKDAEIAALRAALAEADVKAFVKIETGNIPTVNNN